MELDTKIPSWLLERESLNSRRPLKGFFFEKSAKSFLRFLARFEEEHSPSFAVRMDTRIKGIIIALVLFSILFAKSLHDLFIFFLFSLLIYFFTKKTIHRIFPFVLIYFLFFLFIAFPAATNLVVNGEIVLPLFYTKGILFGVNLPQTIGITKEGLISLARLFLRSFSSLLLTLFLFGTTPIEKILRDLPLPSSFKILFLIMLLNIKKLLKKSYDTFLAGISRSPISPDFNKRKNITGLTLAKVFQESVRTSEEIHLAMNSRCWNKKMFPPSRFVVSSRNLFPLFAVLILVVMVFSL